jgi:hypothetical protein
MERNVLSALLISYEKRFTADKLPHSARVSENAQAAKGMRIAPVLQ